LDKALIIANWFYLNGLVLQLECTLDNYFWMLQFYSYLLTALWQSHRSSGASNSLFDFTGQQDLYRVAQCLLQVHGWAIIARQQERLHK
jgi:hypothetical protein